MNINSSMPVSEVSPGMQVAKTKIAVQPQVQPETADNKSHKHVKSEKSAEFQAILSEHDISMKFSTNEPTNQVVVRLVDDKTGETVIQIPNEVSLKLAAANIKLQGQIVDETV